MSDYAFGRRRPARASFRAISGTPGGDRSRLAAGTKPDLIIRAMPRERTDVENRPLLIPYPRDRRQTPRLEVLGHVHGHLVSLDARMVALDLSENGFSMETTFPVDAGEEHDFRLVGPQGTANRLRARASYCTRHLMSDGTPRFVTGLTFVDPVNPGPDLVDQLLEVLSFDVE